MKRVSFMGALAGVALMVTAGTATAAPELYQYFGGCLTDAPTGVPAAPDKTTNPKCENVAIGQTVYLPVWMKILTTGTTVRFYTFEVHATSANGGVVTGAGGQMRNLTDQFGGHPYTLTQPLPGDNTPDSANGYLRVTRGTGGGAIVIGPDFFTMGAQFGPLVDNPANGDRYVGYVSYTAQAAGHVDLYMNTPRGDQVVNVYQMGPNPTDGASNGVAFGATPAGTPDGDLTGLAFNQFSAFPDAGINIVPEPGTLGLLAMGLLALRRRRS